MLSGIIVASTLVFLSGPKNSEQVFIRAAKRGDLVAVHQLVEIGVNVDSRSGYYKTTPLIAASQRGHKDVVSFLIKNGADVNLKDATDGNRTALDYATYNCHKDIIRTLIKNGAKVSKHWFRRFYKGTNYALRYVQCRNMSLEKMSEWHEISKIIVYEAKHD